MYLSLFFFDNTVININQLALNLLQPIFKSTKKHNICFLSNTKNIFTSNIQINYEELDLKKKYTEVISTFVFNFNIITKIKIFKTIWEAISPCLSLNLIHKGYLKLSQNRFERFKINDYSPKNQIIDENEFLSLYAINCGSTFKAELIYHIERGEFLIVKIINIPEKRVQELIQRK